jgi:hypothetical protein
MQPDQSSEDREVKTPREARQGQIIRGGAMRRVLFISIALVVIAFLVIFFVFAS